MWPGVRRRCRRARHRCRPDASRLPASTSAGSRLPCTTRSAPRRRRASLIDVRQSSPSTCRPGGAHRLEQVVAADAEVDAGHTGMACGERGEDRCRVGQHEAVVVGRGSARRPRSRTAGTPRAPWSSWRVDGGRRRAGPGVHHVVPQHRVGVHQRLGVLVGAARPALDQVAGDGERGAGEGEQRDSVREFGGEELDGLQRRTAYRPPARTAAAGPGRPRSRSGAPHTGPVPGATSMPKPTAWAGTTMSL